MSALPYPSRSSARVTAATRRPAALAVAIALVAGAFVPLGFAQSASAAAPTDFSNSFEPSDADVPFANQVELDGATPVQQNVKGEPGGSVLPSVKTVSASGENAPNEAAVFAADGDSGSKWLVFTSTAWLQYELTQSLTVVRYSMTSGGDAPERDPKNWTVSGSTDGTTWTVVDTQTDQTWADSQRGVTKDYTVATPGTFPFYRLDITANHSGGLIQLADWKPFSSEGAGTAAAPITTAVGSGPSSGYNMKARMGFTGTHSLKYSGQHTAAGRGYATNRLFDANIPVTPTTRLSYKVFPEFTGNDLQYPSTYVAVNLHFTDGTSLSQLTPVDAYGISATATGQGAGKILYTNQWNSVKIDVGTVAPGKTIDGVLLSYDNPAASATTAFQGWIDDVKIEATPAGIDGSSLTNYVDTRRGTNSSGSFSRGSNEAITSVPNGFNFLVPVTDATATSREYSYQQDNDDQNRTRFEGLGVSHEPSPWMGDRNQFSVMPVDGGAPNGDAHARAQTFSHDNEVAQPDYYGVTLDNGVKAEMTPTNRGMVMQFTFTGATGSAVLDSPTGDGAFTVDQATGHVSGWIDHGAGFVAGQSRMFVSGTFDSAPTAVGTAPNGRPLTTYATFDTSASKTVTLRLATSLISLDQAAHNLDLEVGADSFATVRDAARALWNDRLGVVTVQDASETQLQTLYSNLYRLNVYPNAQFENTGSAKAPVYKYASPVTAKTGASTATQTNAKISTGKMYVNNGFWDTYRTVWPAYSMLYPKVAAELVDGFTDQYRDGGWIARWSSPGYANIMTGTSSDVSFADAYLRGVELPDALATYDAALKNATTASGNEDVGRKSLGTSAYLGFTPATQGESVSWATEGYINDFGIGNMAAKLAVDPKTPESRRAQLLEESEYFLDRSTNYVNMFDPAVDFFQARNADGTFAVPADQYNPKTWWGPYTETNGWNFAFHAPHDPNGLANLYGGKAGLEAKLDEFFATPETSLGGIHEEAEARDGRYGQWGVSNQVSHHIPFIYNAAGAPAKAQKIVREALQRSYAGSDIGQGYAGDEDNGEMSAWYIFNALGFYPLQTGSDQLVLGSPLFTKATVKLAGGKSLVINASGNSSTNVYVQSLKVNGVAHSSTTVDSDLLTAGGTLDFTMGATPSAWGTGADDAPASLTSGTDVATPLRDSTDASIASITSAGGENVAGLVDNSSATAVTFATATPSVTLAYKGAKQKPTFYTVTAGATPGADPSAWTLEGSNDGVAWTTVDSRTGVSFANRGELKPFKLASPGTFGQFRLTVTAGGPTIALSELELLTDGSGSQAGELMFSPSQGLTASSGVEAGFDLGIVSGGSGTYTASIDWADGSAGAPATVGAPTLGNYAVSATHTFDKAGVYRATVTVSDGVATTRTPVVVTVDYIDPNGLRAAFDSTCIADDGVGGNCDAKGISFPRAGLKAGGLEQGVEHDVPGTALKFTLPVIPAGEPDNATGAGQTIAVGLGAGATSLSFIGAATEKNQDTTATVNFADGGSETIPLQFSDWTKGGNQAATPLYGNIEVVKSSYRLVGANPRNTASYFFSTVPYVIPQGRTVVSITMPVQPGEPGVEGRVHVFAIASDGVRTDLAFTATVGADFGSVAGTSVTADLAEVTMADASAPMPQARVQWGDASDTEDAKVTVDGAGHLRLSGTHTYAAAGTYTVSVTVGNDSATTHLTLTATVEAPPVFHTTLAVSPADGVLAGDSFSVTGDGYAAGETVKVVLHTAEEVTASVTAGTDGTIASSLTVPDGTVPGLFSVTALGDTSAMPATATLTVKPVVVAPVYAPHVRMSADSGRPGDTVTASGTGFAPGETVTVTFHSAPVELGSPTVDRLGALDFTFAIPAGAEVGEHTVELVGSASAVPVSLAFRVLPAATPGDGSTSASGPTEPSVVHRLGMTGLDVRPALLIGGLAIAAGLVLLLVRRRRQRSEETAARDL
jgi:predicted alpha-1,2-mannosidase